MKNILLKLNLLLFFLCLNVISFAAAPPNMTCATATTLTQDALCISGTTNGGGFSSEPNTSCATGNAAPIDGSVWYTVTATDTLLSVSLNNTTNVAGYLSNSGTIALYSAGTSCTPTLANEIGCAVSANASTPAVISLTNATIGATYLVQVTHNKTTGFQDMSFCIAAATTNNDCDLAQQICINTPISAPVQGIGTQDLSVTNRGCLAGNEHSGLWYNFQIETGGTVEMVLDWNGSADFDWAFWGPYDDFTCPPSGPPTRCSYCGSAASGSLDCSQLDTSEGANSCNSSVDCIDALANEIYYLFIDDYTRAGTGFSLTWSGTATVSCDPITPLPIELASFTGHNQERQNLLLWTTFSEKDNEYFTIERSKNGEAWGIVGYVPGALNSQEKIDYHLIDEEPFDVVTYYRLKQTDIDGAFKYSEVISVASEMEIHGLLSDVYPNPTEGNFYFVFGGQNMTTDLTVEVVDQLGKVIYSNIVEEFNNSQAIEVDASNLSKGIYYLRVTQGDTYDLRKITKY